MSDAPTFERARRPEHKEQRRLAILAAASAEATERGVRNVTLGDIATAAGMAKSNVLRYFGTREEIYLELCIDAFDGWIETLREIAARDHPSGPAEAARAVARSLEGHALLCDLVSQSTASLEHNVRPEHGRDFKVALFSALAEVGTVVARAMPELEGRKIFEAGMVVYLMITAVWPTCTTPDAITELMDPRLLALLPATFADRMELALHPFFAGLLAI